MLEPMADFFDSRLDIYDEHQLTCIDRADEFFTYTASLLPTEPNASVLDLGCGTGLELSYYFPQNPTARVTGIDIAPGMLKHLRTKFKGYALDLRLGSYFTLPLEENRYDAAVSVESFHHFTAAEKLPLFAKIRNALKDGGALVLTDYYALSDEEEAAHRSELLRLRAAEKIPDGTFVHFDTPLTVAHETETLCAAGFSTVEVMNAWGATHTLRAIK